MQTYGGTYPYSDSDIHETYDLSDALCEFLLGRPGGAWFARAEVIGGCLVCTAGLDSAVWLLHPSDIPGADAVIAQTFAECREIQARLN